MTYTKRTDIDTSVAAQRDGRGVITAGFDPGESVVELQSGDLVAVAVRSSRDVARQCSCFETSARWIEADGETKCDAQGHAVATLHRHVPPGGEASPCSDEVMRCGLLLVLGEPVPTQSIEGQEVPVVEFDDEILTSASVARAIVAAQRTFRTVDTGELL